MYIYESSEYRGDWEAGRRHGWGHYLHQDGSSYRGEYLYGRKHGYGVCTFPDGSVYDGEWRGGKMTGPATYTYPDGLEFRGMFRDNKKCGKGVYVFPDGGWHHGELQGEGGLNKHGMVVDEPVDGCNYVGSSVHGQRHGLGIYFYSGGAAPRPPPADLSSPNPGDPLQDSSCLPSSQVPECELSETSAQRNAEGIAQQHLLEDGPYCSLEGSLESSTAAGTEVEAEQSLSWVGSRDIYKGEWRHGLRHGHGEFVKRGEYRYTGEYCDDVRHGEGEVVFFHPEEGASSASLAFTSAFTSASPSLSSVSAAHLFIMNDDNDEHESCCSYLERLNWAVSGYCGEWQDDREDGHGMKTYLNGSLYEGEFVAGIEHGKGVFRDSVNGSVYDGDWVQGKRHGQATFKLKGGETYVGEYRGDVKHGRGTYTARDGVTFDVEFRNDEIVGKGLFRPPKEVSPHYFEFEFDEDGEEADRSEKGPGGRRDKLLTLRDGSGYAGGTKAGARHGQGSYEYTNGALYEGSFVKGVMQGQGVYSSGIGSVYRGQFKGGKKHGQGEWTRRDGSSYVGGFKNDLMEGQGVRKSADGGVYDGELHAHIEVFGDARDEVDHHWTARLSRYD